MIGARTACAARVACVVAAAACGERAPAGHVVTPRPGISIALYQQEGRGYAVVEERRWVELPASTLALDHIAAGVPLSALVLEPLGDGALAIGACTRDASDEPAPRVRCQVRGRGRHLLRVVYPTTTLAYRAQHDVTMTAADRATIASRFAIETPAWGARAEVRLYAGVPGGEPTPEPIASGAIALDGSIAVLTAPPREAPARLRWIYDGLPRGGTSAAEERSSPVAIREVWVWLELEAPSPARGAMHVHVAVPGEPVRDVDVPADGAVAHPGRVRVPLWIDPALHGLRARQVLEADGARLVDRLLFSVGNTGVVAREVWVEERLRRARRRTLQHAWPGRASVSRAVARARMVVPSGGLERAGFEVAYEY